jgi:hypothetical protein
MLFDYQLVYFPKRPSLCGVQVNDIIHVHRGRVKWCVCVWRGGEGIIMYIYVFEFSVGVF